MQESHLIPTDINVLHITSLPDLQTKVTTQPLPELQDGEALIRVFASPLSHFDLAVIKGKALVELPLTPGLEFSGFIIDAKGPKTVHLIGKKAAGLIQSGGTFKEYVIAPVHNLIILSEETDLEEAACAFVNPLTALGLIEHAEHHGAKAIINGSAHTSIGHMIRKLAQEKHLTCINVVTKYSQVEELKNLNADHVLNSSDGDFEAKLTELVTKANASIAFDDVGGDFTNVLIKALGSRSLVVVYGNSSGKNISCDATALRWLRKSVQGFSVLSWIKGKNEEERAQLFQTVGSKFSSVFKSKIGGKFGFSNLKDALYSYKLNPELKVLILPDF